MQLRSFSFAMVSLHHLVAGPALMNREKQTQTRWHWHWHWQWQQLLPLLLPLLLFVYSQGPAHPQHAKQRA